MITQKNLTRLKKYVESGNTLTLETLKQFGFHIGDIAYLVETGKLGRNKDGGYHYLNGNVERKLISENRKCFNYLSPKVYLSLLQSEKRIEINTHDSEWELLEEKSRVLEKTNGIIILKAMSKERRHKIYKFVRGIPCLVAFPIDYSFERKRVVLKYYNEKQVDVSKLLEEGNEAYCNRNFQLCIEKYLEVIAHLKRPKFGIYAKLGLAYMQIHQNENAILYLTVANELLKEEGKSRDFSELIKNLKQKRYKMSSEKLPVPFQEEEFKDDINECYELKSIEEMLAFIDVGKTVEEVSDMFSLSEEQRMLFQIVLAKNCYKKQEYSLGDFYLKQVEKRKNKTKRVKLLLEEIRRNKRFYQHRKIEEAKIFQL